MITVEVQNKEAFKKIEQKLIQRNSLLYIRNMQLSYMVKTLIIANLYQVIGEKSKHFIVQVSGGSHSQTVSVRARDNIGLFIYYGTKRHHIASSGPMPIGGGQFAGSVDHPGSKSNKQLIDDAIGRAKRQAKAYYRMLK
jgi:hypothetical protein